jgi:DNA-binding GntR family transcriptional regulator
MSDSPTADAESPAEQGSLTDEAYRQLEELIVTLQLEPGTVLSESALVKRLGIGRTPIREALQRLGREGLVAILPRRGILVAEINVERQLKILEVRRELERLMARLACRRGSDDECAEFAEIAEGMDRAAHEDDDIVFMRFDRQLNNLLSHAARNEFATRAMGLTQGLSRRFWYLHYKRVADLPRCARLHAQQARAVSRRNPDEAAEATEHLIDYVENFTRATLDRGAQR